MTKCEKKQGMLLNYDHSRLPGGGDERVKRHAKTSGTIDRPPHVYYSFGYVVTLHCEDSAAEPSGLVGTFGA